MKSSRYNQDIKEHEKWLSTNRREGRQLVLENEDLSFLSISDADLSESVFINCDLKRAVFINDSIIFLP